MHFMEFQPTQKILPKICQSFQVGRKTIIECLKPHPRVVCPYECWNMLEISLPWFKFWCLYHWTIATVAMLIMPDQWSWTMQWDIHINKRTQFPSEVAGYLQKLMISRNGSWWKPRAPLLRIPRKWNRTSEHQWVSQWIDIGNPSVHIPMNCSTSKT